MDRKSDAEIESMWRAWIAQEDEYLARDNPKAYADKVIDGSRPFSAQLTTVPCNETEVR